jgi:hypothetical protein
MMKKNKTTLFFFHFLLKFIFIHCFFTVSSFSLDQEKNLDQNHPVFSPKIVLLTSLEEPHRGNVRRFLEFWKSKDWTIAQNLEEVFLQQIHKLHDKDSSHHRPHRTPEIVIKHYADQYDLWTILKDPQNLAIFWVSHMGAASKVNKHCLMEVESVITDYQHHNLIELFRYTHPNLQFLHLVGCSSRKIYQQLKATHAFDQSPHLQVESFSWWVPAVYGLHKVLKKFIKKNRWSQCQQFFESEEFTKPTVPSSPYKITITRKIPDDAIKDHLQSVRIVIKGKIMTVLPKGHPGDVQIETIDLPFSDIKKKNDLKIIVDSGSLNITSHPNTHILGTFHFEGNWLHSEWKIFSTINSDQIMGTTQHIYQYRGELPFSSLK